MNKNTNFSLLKIFMSFEVVICHFCVSEMYIAKPFKMIGSWAVPTFMLLSFILTEKHFSNIKKGDLCKRIKRLVYPQIIWGGYTG